MQSTDVNRTIMSGYSEFMGLYPPGQSGAWQLTPGELQSLSSGRGMPSLTIRSADSINQALGSSALPNGFVSVPQITFVEPNELDDIMFTGCDFVQQTQS